MGSFPGHTFPFDAPCVKTSKVQAHGLDRWYKNEGILGLELGFDPGQVSCRIKKVVGGTFLLQAPI